MAGKVLLFKHEGLCSGSQCPWGNQGRPLTSVQEVEVETGRRLELSGQTVFLKHRVPASVRDPTQKQGGVRL